MIQIASYELQESYELARVFPARLCTLLDALQSNYDVPVSFFPLPLVSAVPYDSFLLPADILPDAHVASVEYVLSTSPDIGRPT